MTEHATQHFLLLLVAFWTGWLLAAWRKRWLTRQRDARELIREARHGTDLTDVHHWSDVCRNCHHQRSTHYDDPLKRTGGCWHGRLGNFCPCEHFEASQ